MRYTNDDFVRLIDAVEDEGGEHLPETCAGDEVDYTIQNKTVHELTHGCENETLFEIPYDPSETVYVREAIMEDDPDRSPFTGPDGTERQPQRPKTFEDEDGNRQIMYDLVERGPEVDGGGPAYARPVRVCAVGDNVGMWPRFRDAMKDAGTR